MIGKLNDKLGFHKAKPQLQPGNSVQANHSTASPNPTEKEKSGIHSPVEPKRLAPKEFHTVTLESPEILKSKNAKKILHWFKVGNNPANSAVISKDGEHLVLVSDGKTSFRKQFFNSWWYKPTYWFKRTFGIHQSDYGINFYFNGIRKDPKHKEPDHVVRETKSHIRKALKANEYKVVSIYKKNPKTGDYDKEANSICLLNNLDHLVKKTKKYSGAQTAKHLEEAAEKNDFARYYAVDRYISSPVRPIAEAEVSRILAEAFYQAHGFDELHIQSKFLEHQNMISDKLIYNALPWTHVYQTNDKKWHETNPQQTPITIVRPALRAKEKIEPYVADLHTLAEIEEAKSFKANKEGERFVNTAADHNLRAIKTLNQEIAT